jgi:hypothetical protein
MGASASRSSLKTESGTSPCSKKAPDKKTMSVLRAAHLAKSYKKRQVISDLSVEVGERPDRGVVRAKTAPARPPPST